jgi:hypothetical protein
MTLSTLGPLLAATPFVSSLLPLTVALLPPIVQLGQRVLAFCQGPITPVTTDAFEKDLHRLLQEIGRIVMQWTLNHLEADDLTQAPAEVGFDHSIYRRRPPSPRRGGIATLFGIIALWRLRYEPCDAGIGLSCIFPLEQRLGIVAGKATPAVASRVGSWTAQHPQTTVQNLLAEEHQVAWSVTTLRHVVAEVSVGVSPLTHQAQVAYLLALLGKAHVSSGPHRPVLAAGRDGIFVPIRQDTKYREAATATVAVLDRRGKRLGTVYLGEMPDPGQASLSQQLTDLVLAVLNGWRGPLPRLQYTTDGGHHPTEYFSSVLEPMRHPRTQETLVWEWVLDYYHACQYITKMAEALFGTGTQAAAAWAAKMRRWLRDKRHGIFRVLHSAAAHYCRWELTKQEQQAYAEAYQYLRKRMALMDYSAYRRRGLAIGSGITEAACKTLFTQRFKQSGMKWSLEGGQVVVDLRVVWLSRLWGQVYAMYLAQLPQAEGRTKNAINADCHEIAA